MSHHTKMAGHLGGRSLHQFLRQTFFRPDMSADCYAIAQYFVIYAKNRIALRQNSKGMLLFPTTASLEFEWTEILF